MIDPLIRQLRVHRVCEPAPAKKTDGWDARFSARSVHAWIEAAVRHTSDPEFGVRAAEFVSPDDGGVFEHLIATAPTVDAALTAAVRYMYLANESARCTLVFAPEHHALRMSFSPDVPRSARDYALAQFFKSQHWLRALPGFECWFDRPAPKLSDAFSRVFDRARCRFDAPFSGWVFACDASSLPLARGDAGLHELLASIAKQQRVPLRAGASASERVRSVLLGNLATPGITSEWVAAYLGVTRRTLVRQLCEEHTSFLEVHAGVRLKAALQLLDAGSMTLSEIATELGFAHVQSFHRAFRRWMHRSPAQYRRQRIC